MTPPTPLKSCILILSWFSSIKSSGPSHNTLACAIMLSTSFAVSPYPLGVEADFHHKRHWTFTGRPYPDGIQPMPGLMPLTLTNWTPRLLRYRSSRPVILVVLGSLGCRGGVLVEDGAPPDYIGPYPWSSLSLGFFYLRVYFTRGRQKFLFCSN